MRGIYANCALGAGACTTTRRRRPPPFSRRFTGPRARPEHPTRAGLDLESAQASAQGIHGGLYLDDTHADGARFVAERPLPHVDLTDHDQLHV